IKNKYKKILAISGPEEYIVSQDRTIGYKKAMEEYKNQENSSILICDDFTYQDGYNNTINFLKKNRNLCEAIFAFDDMIALGALRAAQSLNIRVPEEIAILGFNDDPIASYMKPALSTVKIPIVKMGEEAARMLIKILNDENYKGEELILNTELVLRESLA
ncbi:LacI family DNA-binding transcriptional regulator, partial [Natronospora cellulosivora (SeqCode)]